jgi:hypothetical protein
VLIAHQQYSVTRIDNNLVENAIRPSAIGKKNWHFIGHPDVGKRSTIIYSLVVSCQRHGKDPLAYLRDVLRRLPAMTTKDDLSPLTPAGWQPAYLMNRMVTIITHPRSEPLTESSPLRQKLSSEVSRLRHVNEALGRTLTLSTGNEPLG